MPTVDEVVAALKAKHGSPREAIKALGLDEALLKRETIMSRPTKLAAVSLAVIKRATNPLLAMDAKVDYMPIVRDLNRKNFSAKKVTAALRTAIKGKTIAKDADLSHVEGALAKLEKPHEPGKELPGTLDEEISPEEHKAMESAAQGESNLLKPPGDGYDAMRSFCKDRGMSDDDVEHLMGIIPQSEPVAGHDTVHHYHARDRKPQGRDESPEEKAEREAAEKAAEDRHPGAKDSKHQHHYADDQADDRRADDRLPGKDKMVSKDELTREVSTAVANERKNQAAIRIALDEALPLVGKLRSDLEFTTPDDVRRHVLKVRGIATDGVNSAGLKVLVSQLRPIGADAPPRRQLAEDADGVADGVKGDFDKMFPAAGRIGAV